MNARFCKAQILLVREEPLLVGVLEGCGQRRHDLATVPEVTANFSPLLELANLLKASATLDGLFQTVEIEGFLVDIGPPIQVIALLFVEFAKGIEVREVRARAWRAILSDLSLGKGLDLPGLGGWLTAFHRV